MATFNHTRGDSPRTPCGVCALQCENWVPALGGFVTCCDCHGLVSLSWLTAASERGEEHVCVTRRDAAALASFDNAELRAECERRHLSVKRDEQLMEGLDVKLRERNREVQRERDEWKWRAETAERTAGVLLFSGPARARFSVEHGGCAICGAPPGAKCTPSCDDHAVADAYVQPHVERGPGIATRPTSEPHAHLDVDLLADDA